MEGIISVCGAMPRIGTTTQCMQLARYIQATSDYKVAYVECNAQDYIWSASEMYQSAKKDASGGSVTIEGIPMYSQSRLSELTKGGVDIDFLILDFGDVNSKSFIKEEYLKGTVNIVVAGVKANEIHFTENILRDTAFSNAMYIFTHVIPSDRTDLLELMGNKAQNTFFAPYTPDPFQKITESTVTDYEKMMKHILKKMGWEG